MIALLCPGQGSQTPGMLNSWLELPGIGEFAAELSEASGIDLIELGTVADADTIRDTKVAQPLIVAASLISARALNDALGAHAGHLGADVSQWAGVIGGHSVGEYAATALTGVLSHADALKLVAVRGRAMATAASAEPTGMAAVLGGDQEDVVAHLAQYGLVGANFNGAGQIVAAGALEDLAKLVEDPLPKTRVIPLEVAGAFHTEFMASALAIVRDTASQLVVGDAVVDQLTNFDGSTLRDGAKIVSTMVSQITRPVRWDACQATLADVGTRLTVELAPGGVLTGLAKRTLKSAQNPVTHVALKTAADIPAAVRAIMEQKGARA